MLLYIIGLHLVPTLPTIQCHHWVTSLEADYHLTCSFLWNNTRKHDVTCEMSGVSYQSFCFIKDDHQKWSADRKQRIKIRHIQQQLFFNASGVKSRKLWSTRGLYEWKWSREHTSTQSWDVQCPWKLCATCTFLTLILLLHCPSKANDSFSDPSLHVKKKKKYLHVLMMKWFKKDLLHHLIEYDASL